MLGVKNTVEILKGGKSSAANRVVTIRNKRYFVKIIKSMYCAKIFKIIFNLCPFFWVWPPIGKHFGGFSFVAGGQVAVSFRRFV